MSSAALSSSSHAQALGAESRSSNGGSPAAQPTTQPTQQARWRQRPIPSNVSASALDTTSDDATAAFIRRTLCAQHPQLKGHSSDSNGTPPIEELLPPLTSSNAVDLQLYALIAIILREFVQTWYNAITPDTSFADEVVHTIAHCTRALEERIRHVDVQDMLLREIPSLVDAHLRAVQMAQQARGVTSPRLVYQALRPHPAVSLGPDSHGSHRDEEASNDAAYRRLLAQGLLAVLLPAEDVQNPCLFALVGEILADMILGQFIAGRLCESAFIYDAISTACEVEQDRKAMSPWAVDATASSKAASRLSQFGLLPDWKAGATPNVKMMARIRGMLSQVSQFILAIISGLRAMMLVLASAQALPRRKASAPSNSTPILAFPLWGIVAGLLQIAERMPWLAGAVSMLQWFALEGPGCVGGSNSHLDRLLAHTLFSPFENPASVVADTLRIARVTLFPGNALPVVPPLADASLSSQASQDQGATADAKKRAAAVGLLNLLPRPMARILFAAPTSSEASGASGASAPKSPVSHQQRDAAELEVMIAAVQDILGVFDDSHLNRCLVYTVLEAVVARVVPELAASTRYKPSVPISSTADPNASRSRLASGNVEAATLADSSGSVRDLLEAKGIGGVVAQAELDELGSIV